MVQREKIHEIVLYGRLVRQREREHELGLLNRLFPSVEALYITDEALTP